MSATCVASVPPEGEEKGTRPVTLLSSENGPRPLLAHGPRPFRVPFFASLGYSSRSAWALNHQRVLHSPSHISPQGKKGALSEVLSLPQLSPWFHRHQL